MRFLLLVSAVLFVTSTVQARVERVELVSRTDVLEGKAFGEAGAYEKVVGKIHFAAKPQAEANKLIVDLEKARRNAAGEIEFASDFYILRPKETARASGSVLLELPNRGGKGILAIVQGGKGSRDAVKEEEFGDGFLLQRGAVVAWLGWQWDVRDEPNMLKLYAPTARGDETSKSQAPSSNQEVRTPITGLVRADFMVNEPQEEPPLGHMIARMC